MTLVASTIVRNEENRYLEIWINHLLDFVDEVRVIDDASTDATRDILTDVGGPRVHVHTNEESEFYVNEGLARQRLLEWTMESKPTYVLSIDADEFIGDPAHVKRLAQKGAHRVYTLQMEEVWSCSSTGLGLRKDGYWGSSKCPILWRAPSTLTNEWRMPDRKLACGREPLPVRVGPFKVSGVGIYHFGWTRVRDRQERAERYFEHDKGAFHPNRHLQSILWSNDQVVQAGAEWPKGLADIRYALVERTL